MRKPYWKFQLAGLNPIIKHRIESTRDDHFPLPLFHSLSLSKIPLRASEELASVDYSPLHLTSIPAVQRIALLPLLKVTRSGRRNYSRPASLEQDQHLLAVTLAPKVIGISIICRWYGFT